MQEKLKQLELLISKMVTRQQALQGENDALKARIRVLENSAEKWKETDGEVRALKEWKKNAQTVLKRLALKREKDIAKAQEEEKKIV